MNENLRNKVLFNHLILECISSHLDQEHLLQCRLVCKFWLDEFSKARIVHIIKLSTLSKISEFIFYAAKPKTLPFDKFHLYNPIKCLFSEHLPRLSSLATIRTLTLTNYYFLAHQLLTEASPTLQHLTLIFPGKTGQKFAELMQSESQLSQDQDQVLPLALPNIKSLTFKSQTTIANSNVIEFFQNCLKSGLETLKIDATSADASAILKCIIEYPSNNENVLLNLTSFYYESPNKINAQIGKLLLQLTEKVASIRKIVFSGTVLKREEFEEFFFILAPQKSADISQNKLHFLNFVTYSDLHILSKIALDSFPNLKTLKFIQNHQLKFEVEENKIYPNLNELNLKFFVADFRYEWLPPEDLSFIIPNCFPNLTVLKFGSGVEVPKNFNFSLIYQKCVNLTRLKIGFEELEDYHLTGLDRDTIKNMKNLTFDELNQYQFKNCTKNCITNLKYLRKLTIKSEEISDVSFFFGFRFLPLLQNLNVFESSNFTLATLELLNCEFENLQKLTICNKEIDPQCDFFRILNEERPGIDINKIKIINKKKWRDNYHI